MLPRFERFVTTLLTGMMAAVVALSVAELGWVLVKDVISPPLVFLGIDELLDLFGLFLLVLVGVELLVTIKAYAREGVVRVDVIIVTAMLAVGRKVIALDPKELPGATLVGIAAIIAALAFAYYVFAQAHGRDSAKRGAENT